MEGVEKVVVDASVAVKWFVPERHYERAVALRDAYLRGEVELAAPDLVLYEVANALRFHRVFRLAPGDVVGAVRALAGLGIVRSLSPEEWLRAIELSVDGGVSVYDAVYGAMALSIGGMLVTSDEELYEKIGGKVRVVMLSELSLH